MKLDFRKIRPITIAPPIRLDGTTSNPPVGHLIPTTKNSRYMNKHNTLNFQSNHLSISIISQVDSGGWGHNRLIQGYS